MNKQELQNRISLLKAELLGLENQLKAAKEFSLEDIVPGRMVVSPFGTKIVLIQIEEKYLLGGRNNNPLELWVDNRGQAMTKKDTLDYINSLYGEWRNGGIMEFKFND